MATVADGSLWTLTEEAAELLVTDGILVRCHEDHVQTMPVDEPIYHLSSKAPEEVGFCTLYGYIKDAEKRLERNVG